MRGELTIPRNATQNHATLQATTERNRLRTYYLPETPDDHREALESLLAHKGIPLQFPCH